MMKFICDSSCLRAFVAKPPERKVSWKPTRSIAIIFFSCVVIFLFSNAIKISGRRLRANEGTWYLSQTMDSAEFFSADELNFSNPPLNFFHSKTKYAEWDKQTDSLEKFSQIKFGYFQKNEFALYLDDSVYVDQKWVHNKKQVDGKFIIDKKNKTLTLDFYLFDAAKASDDIDDWIKGVSIKYNILEFSPGTLVLEKIK